MTSTLTDPRDTDWYADGWYPTEDGYVIIGNITEDEARHRATLLWHNDTEDSWEESISATNSFNTDPFGLRRDWQQCDENDHPEDPNGLHAWLFH